MRNLTKRKKRAAGRGYLKWAIVVLLVCAAIFFVGDWYSKYMTRIGVIRVSGSIDDFTYADNAYAALSNPDIKAVVVVVDSPGGTVQACFEAEATFRELKMKKPVVVTMDEYATSGAYLISTASDYIFARSATITAGLGVIAIWVSYENMLKEAGIDYYVWKSGENKDLGAEYRPPTENEKIEMQNLVDNLMYEMVTRIKMNRPQVISTIDELMDGSVIYGWEAPAYQLVDEIGTYKDAVKKAAKLAGLAEGAYTVVNLN